MRKKLKHLLPPYSLLDHCSLTEKVLQELVLCVQELEDKFETTIAVNKNLCSVHASLTHSSYNSFYQIALTDSTVNNEPLTFDDLDNINKELTSTSRTQSYRLKNKLSTEDNSPMNESSFTSKTKIYTQYQSLFDRIFDNFKGTPTRIRLVKLKSGENITPHIDYDPSYSVRVIIPIISDADCVNLFWVKNNIESVSLTPGKAYFLNTGFKHAVVNYSKNDRYTLMITLKNTADIDHLLP